MLQRAKSNGWIQSLDEGMERVKSSAFSPTKNNFSFSLEIKNVVISK